MPSAFQRALKVYDLSPDLNLSHPPDYLDPSRPVIRLAASIRVSKINGRDKLGRAFMSPEEQIGSILTHAPGRNWWIVAWYDELDVPAGDPDREGLKAAIHDATSGAADGIVVARVDRFSRDLLAGLIEVKKLEQADKEFFAPDDGIWGLKGDDEGFTPGRLLFNFMLMMAEEQLRRIKSNWKKATRRHIADGVPHVTAFGYRRPTNAEGKRQREPFVPFEPEASAVRMMFELRGDGMSWSAIAEALDEAGFEPTSGGKWPWTSVRNIVHSRVYLGELRITYKDPKLKPVVNLNAHEPLVSLDIWERCRLADSKTPKPRDREVYMLAGMVRCAGCGWRMSGQTQQIPATGRQPAKQIRYYRCKTRRRGHACPARACVNADELEALVVARFLADYRKLRFVAEGSSERGDKLHAATEAAKARLRWVLTSPEVAETVEVLGESWRDEAVASARADVLAAQEAEAEHKAGALGEKLDPKAVALWESDLLSDEDRRDTLSAAYAVIAVRAAPDMASATTEPIDGRVRLWQAGEAGVPEDLPGRRLGGRGSGGDGVRPIVF